ncbi:D-alanyl-D-alanine carboxypeptidase [Bradyrhizobium sp.]|uniref:D-alanyl-D-alanine carboxypeptidase n=1 Tax=Bradyrhizobium sp. TaxID=376 RepID=UPI001EC9F601|nr:D-alanyl-D-alanine carboxypeptidase [Bradyrhizobium sp.]MBV9982909.1 D-alanyl-D-alanine carboxypeptidase [Bradyrhizobium sp.]
MLRKNLASSRLMRVGVFGLVSITAAIVASDSADARHLRQRHHARHAHHDAEESYSPAFASIIVDGNSGATLTATNPDGMRHPASLTKMMTLYLLFERLDAGKMKLDTEMPVSEHASDQDPTKLDLRPGQTIRVEDAIKGLITRSANDAAVVIAEAIGGDEENFAKLMTRKAHALGMSRTVYRNASGLPNDEQVTTARDQSMLGRALQDRFPRYYRYFSTTAFTFRGRTIRGHNHLLGSVEGVDGIKTGYTRGSGFNLVTSMHRGNRFLIGVVLGGHSGNSRDAIMRNLLAENLEKAATKRSVAAITERNANESSADVADAETTPAQPAPMQLASADPAESPASAPAPAQPAAPAKPRVEPAPLTSGVIQTQPIATIPGSTEPMKPVKVRTVQVKAQPVKLASVTPPQPSPPTTSSVAPARPESAASSNAAGAAAKPVEKAEFAKPEPSRPETPPAAMPPQPPGFGTGNGILGVLPASSLPPSSSNQAMAYAEPAPAQSQPPTSASKPAVLHSGWIVQVGALDSEDEAHQRIEAARDKARGLLSKADPFTETVIAKGDHKLFRARFAGLDRDKAEAVCKALKRAEISCMTVRN